jgi:NDP-sugar pyrophosphorylase family protein
MKGMILAAGYGTRLRPVTYTLPKPMVPVCNRPLIAYAVEQFLRAGVRDIVVNLHHLPEPIERYLTATFGAEARFEFSFEPEILGTGGGVRKVRPLLDPEEEFFLVNADTIQFPRYDELQRARHERDSLAALTLRHPPEGDRFTKVWLDAGLITGFGRGTGEPLMFAGSHLISRRIFEVLPDKDFSGITDEVYQPVLTNGSDTIAAVVEDGLWFDIGTPARYQAAARALLRHTLQGDVEVVRGSRVESGSVVADDARIDGTIESSSVGSGTRIGANASVRNSSVWDRCTLAEGASVDGCIVAHDVEIPAGVTLRNAFVVKEDAAIESSFQARRQYGLVITPI